MKLRYLTPLVLTLVGGVAWSVHSYLEADRELRLDSRLQPVERPGTQPGTLPAPAPLLPTAQVLSTPDARPTSS